MDYNFRLGKVSSTFIYILEGVVAFIVAIISNRFTIEQIIKAGSHWLIGLLIIVVLSGNGKWKQRISICAQHLFTIVMAICLSIAFDSSVIFCILLLLQWMSNLIYSRKSICNSLLIVHILAATIMRFRFVMLRIYEYPSLIIVLICTNIFANILIETLNRQKEQNIDHQQSLDDLLALVEVKYDEARAANSAKSSFLANMSHEIRTPINSILGFDTMILRENKDETIKGYASNIQSAGQSLLSIINDILDFSKIESGKMEIIPVQYELSSVINDVYNMINPKAKEKKLSFELNIDNSIPNKLYGDDVRIRQVLVNLLTNAVKYTNEGKVTLSISGKVVSNTFMMYCSVKDTGIGIKEENLSELFTEFVRIEEKRNRNIEGTGLGINIVTQLLSLMGSSLQVESVYGKGSNFFFTVNQSIVSNEPIGDFEDRIKAKNDEYKYEVSFTIADKKILVVDDNLMNRVIIAELLKELKCQIDQAESGMQCLDMVKDTKYDLIFMDHMMPEMDGIETLQNMKAMEDYPCKDTPVIILTANAVSGAKEEYLTAGFDDYLSKPIVPEKLEELIKLKLS